MSSESEDARKWKRFQVMKVMHWNLWEYERTPASFVDEIYAWIKTERQMQQEEMERGR